MQKFYQHSISLLIRLPFCFCLCKNYVNGDAECADVNIGERK